MVLYHLFFVESIKNYSNMLTRSENCTNAHDIMIHLHDHPKKVSNGFENVVLHIPQSATHVSLSAKGKCERYKSFLRLYITNLLDSVEIFLSRLLT